MKVIGFGGDNKIICEIDRSELQKFFNCYYNDRSNPYVKTIDDLKAGSILDLGSGYDHLSEIKLAMQELKDFVKAHERVMKGISSGLLLLAEVKTESTEQTCNQ